MIATPHLQGLRDTIDKYDAFMLDIFGVLHNGIKLYSGTLECLREIKNHGKKICLVSNTPNLPKGVRENLISKGLIPDLYDHVASAGLCTHEYLSKNYSGKKVWFSGGREGFQDFAENIPVTKVETAKEADLIVNSFYINSRENDDWIYTKLLSSLNDRKPMLCVNPDLVVHIGSDLFTCSGTYAKWYEQEGGEVVYLGKPHNFIYNRGLEMMDLNSSSRICAIGDALHTDIQGANRMGFSSIWVLSGIHWEELRLKAKPSHPDLDRVAETITMSPYKPTATLTEFCW